MALAVISPPALTDMKLLRMPSVQGDTVAFVYGGDIWKAPLKGGLATRLTSSPGSESWPRFSPDGASIAFSGQYDTTAPQVYVMPSEGGQPVRLTFESNPCNVTGWTPDGQVAYASNYGSTFTGRLWLINPKGGMPVRTDLAEFSNGSFSADGKQIAYNRNNSYAFNWRHYRGGTQGRVCFYDFSQQKYWELPSGREQNYWPMWVGDKVYYLSDKTMDCLNLWVYDTKSKSDRQLTKFTDGDIKDPNTDGKHIVFERDGVLTTYDIQTNTVEIPAIQVPSDDLLARTRYRRFGQETGLGDVSPSGKRALIEARGDIYSVPAKNGETRNLSSSSGSREQDPAWSPDGQSVAFMSDKSGEDRIYTMPQMGGAWTEVDTPKDVKIQNFGYFPDGKKMWFTSVDSTLYTFDPATKTALKVYSDTGNGNNFDISADGGWIAYTLVQPNLFSAVYLYNVADKTATKVTEGYYDDGPIAFDLNGKYLYFVSSRTYGANLGAFDIDLHQDNVQRVYAALLQNDQTNPLLPPNDEEPVKSDEGKAEPKKDGATSSAMKIDLQGLDQRLIPLPWPPGSYQALYGVENGVLAMVGGTLQKFDFDSKKPDTVLSNVSWIRLNAKHTKMAYQASGVVGISDVKPGVDPNAGKVPLGDVATDWNPRDEWKQIYWEAWRFERDHFYDPDMVGLNWKEIGNKYAALLPYCSDRADLSYLLGLLIGELGTGHAYLGGGDNAMPSPPITTGMLGADYDVANGHVQFKKIYKGLNFEPERRGPLGAPGVNVNDGDYLLAIDGHEIDPKQDFHQFLVDKAEKPVKLVVNSKPTMTGSRTVTVRPVASESDLRYISWVESNREYVRKASGGKIGYMHVPNTSIEGIIEFMKGYYSNSDAVAFVIDERYNGGGFIPTFFVDYLTRSPQSVFRPRYGQDRNLPAQTLVGPKVMLINEFAGSGGDMFPWLFRRNKVGPLIGTRTWGGLVGINGFHGLVDGGGITAPAFGIYDRDKGEWIAENKGIDPDIEVDARPDLIAQGKDPVLDKAIEVLTAEIKKGGKELPKPQYPRIKK